MEYVSVRGVDVPAIGLGTWRLAGNACRRTVTTALELGYRHVDTAQGYGKSPAQVALRWLLQQENVAAIPKATSREHLEANLDVFDFELTPAEMKRVARPSKLETVRGILKQSLPF